MKKFLLLISLLTLSIGAFSQLFVNTGTLGGTFDDAIQHVSVLENGDVIIAGTFTGTADLYPGPLESSYTSNGQSDIFLGRVSQTGTLIWMKTFGSAQTDDVLDLEISGNTIIIGGYFNQTINFNPDGSNATVTSQGVTDGFIAAYDLNGNYVYHQTLAGPAGEEIMNIALQPDGAPAFAGYAFSGTIQVGNQTINNNGGGDIVVVRMNNVGEVTSTFNLGSEFGNSFGYPDALTIDNQNNIIVGGSFSGQIFDFDPSGETQGFSASSDNNAFVASYSSNNSFNWVKPYGFNSYETVDALVTDVENNIYLFGEFSGQISFDPSFPMIVGTPSVANLLLAKLNSNGEVIQVGQISGTSQFKVREAVITLSDNIYIGGYYEGVADIDPLEGITNLGTDNNSGFILRLSTDLELINGESVGIGSTLRIFDIALTPEQNVLAAGYFLFTTIIQSENENTELISAGGEDGFITMLFQDLCSDFLVSLASITYPTCANAGEIVMSASGGTAPYEIQWLAHPDNTAFSLPLTIQGSETVTVNDANGCSRTRMYIIPGPINDAEVDVIVNVSHTPFVLGQQATIFLNVYNHYCDMASGQIRLTLDPNMSVIYATNPDFTQEGNILTWNYNDITFESGHITIEVVVLVLPEIGLGSEIVIELEALEEAGVDIDVESNIVTQNAVALASYDPNDKQVYPQGVCEPQWTLQPETFTYTVRFQNIGNAPAQNVFIYDTLSTHLNPQSVVLRGYDPFIPIIEIVNGNVLTFSFLDIYLPDSLSNPEESIGYVIFEIAPYNSDLPDNTAIENKAGIVFDMNEPIITNTVLNTIVDEIPVINNDFYQDNETGIFIAEQNNATYTWYSDCDFNSIIEGQTNQSLNLQDVENFITQLALEVNYMGCTAVFSDCLILSNVTEQQTISIQLYPNPATDNITILTENIEQAHYIIYDLSGKQVMTGTLNTPTLSIATLPSGIYTLHLNNYNLKFVKE